MTFTTCLIFAIEVLALAFCIAVGLWRRCAWVKGRTIHWMRLELLDARAKSASDDVAITRLGVQVELLKAALEASEAGYVEMHRQRDHARAGS